MSYNKHLIHYIVDQKIFGKEVFFLADIGASRGIDPLIKECKR